MRGVHLAKRLLDRVHDASGFIAGSCILLLMAGVIADIAVRTFAGHALRGVVDYSETGIVLCAFVALGFAQRDNAHVAVDTLVENLPRPAALFCTWLVVVVTVPLLAWLVVETTQLALHSYHSGEYRFGLSRVKLWPARAMLPIGLGLWAIEILRQAVNTTAGLQVGTGHAAAK